MGGNYREAIADERLEGISTHVRGWLWPPEPVRKKTAKMSSGHQVAGQKPGSQLAVE
jgi:hypothetical protein